MKIRIKFTKTGHLRFIGNLDVMRYFQKLMRRANVDIRYSEGFSPHQIMSFAQPLGVGDTSEGEYVDIEVLSSGCSEEMIRCLNEKSCPEIQIKNYVRILDETRRSNAMSCVAAADYQILFQKEKPAEEILSSLFSQESILVLRKTKTKEMVADIRPLILDWALKPEGLFVRLATGSAANCKPDTLMDAYDALRGLTPQKFAYHFHRLEMYAKKEEQWVPLYQLGETLTPEMLTERVAE